MLDHDKSTRTFTLGRATRSRLVRVTAATVVAGLAVGAVVTSGGGAAGAAPVRAQSVGRFLDGSVGGMAIQSLVDLKDARAMAAPNTSKRQGVNAELFNAADIPIGNGLKLPGGGVFDVGAANQIAVAKTDGYSYGASGAVENNGGAQLTDDNNAYPADGTINISGAALNSVTIPGVPAGNGLPSLPGVSASSLGGIVGKVGAVQALAQTATGGKILKPQSSVADLQLAIGSPALAALITQLKTLLNSNVLAQLETAAAAIPGASAALKKLSASCSLATTTPEPITAAGGGVVINFAKATITIDAAKLLKKLASIDIAHLSTSNFDLTKFIVQKLPNILSTGLTGVVTSITTALKNQFLGCVSAIKAIPTLGTTIYTTLKTTLAQLQSQLVTGVGTIADPLTGASSGGLATLANGLTGVADIGLNVQSGPNIQPHNTEYKYTTKLAKTPDQATSVVNHQSLVRAIEIDLLDAAGTGPGLPSGLPSLPGTSAIAAHQLAGARQAAAGGSAVTLALGNAAAGPSTAAPTAPTTTPTTSNPTGTDLPTGVPAGAAGHNDGGSPLLPLALVMLGLVAAGGGVLSLRTRRGKFSR